MPEVAAPYVDPADLVPEEEIAGHLGRNEKLLWAGRPSLALVLRAHDFYFIPLGLLLGAMAIASAAPAITKSMPLPAVIGALFLTFLAFYACFVRFFVDIRQRECIFYGLTNQRVIIAYGVFTRRVKSLALATLCELSLRERRNGAGVIRFGKTSATPLFALYICSAPPNRALYCFELPSDARQVCELILAAQRQTKSDNAAETSNDAHRRVPPDIQRPGGPLPCGSVWRSAVYQSPEEVIAAELSPEEKLLWAGRPRLGVRLQAMDAFLIPFSILWCGFAIFWETMVILSGAPWFFMLSGVPFVAIGLYFVIGRFFVDARQRANTFYAVTSERVLIISGLFRRQVKSLEVDTITDLSLTERHNGGGTISFGSLPLAYSLYSHVTWPGIPSHSVPQFDLASNARQIYDIIRSAQREARQRR